MKRDSIFLTAEQALDAICIDFRQYEPQIMLFSEILRLISDGRIHLKKETGKKGAWINQPGRRNMYWLEGPDLIAYMCKAINDADMNPEFLVSVCSRVFQTRARLAVDSYTGREGIQIDTNMDSYTCRQCGRCCQNLDYHDEVTVEDVELWKSLGRMDILEWVAVTRKEGLDIAYRIWTPPGTSQVADTCPFLKKEPSANRWQCQIHEVKPAICRNYPVSRKHAVMTGCMGFKKC